MHLLREATCTACLGVRMELDDGIGDGAGGELFINGEPQGPQERARFARADGFSGWAEMADCGSGRTTGRSSRGSVFNGGGEMNPNYIKPPSGDEVEWFSGPPPEVGWWPASLYGWTHVLRWWDGKCWSEAAFDTDGSSRAADRAKSRAGLKKDIKWTRRWWEPKPKAETRDKVRLLASYTDETVGTIDDVYKGESTVTVMRRSGYASHNGRGALYVQDTGNGLIARFPPIASTEQDYYVCLDYSQARDLALGLLGHNDALRIKEIAR